jgi:hypothetical protein
MPSKKLKRAYLLVIWAVFLCFSERDIEKALNAGELMEVDVHD